jgi:hypothetical protein
VRFVQLTHQLPVDRCDASIQATIGVYTVQAEGFADLGTAVLPAPEVTCSYPKLPTRRLWPGVAGVAGPVLRGVDYDTRVDGSADVYLHWCGPGKPILVQVQDAEAWVGTLAPGHCQTTRMTVSTEQSLDVRLRRPDGPEIPLGALPLPAPRPGERYLPYGDEFVLVDSSLTETTPAKATLTWLTTRPVVDDYAVSVRLLDGDGGWLAVHDTQPGLGAMPTLKWVTRGVHIRDPHLFADTPQAPAAYAVVVYERFRLTPLRSAQGDLARYQLP